MNRREFIRTSGLTAAGAPFWMGVMPEDLWGKIPSGIKITGIKTFLMTRGAYVKIYTNQGVVGLGKTRITPRVETCQTAIMENERMLIGQDPTNIEFLWQAMFRWTRWRGGPILTGALSAIEIALWDILGKLLDAPIYKLLGGAAREKIRLYIGASGKKGVQRAKELGYSAIKCSPLVMDVIDGRSILKRPWNLKRAVAQVEEMRIEAGDDFDILIDAHSLLTPKMALEFANAIEPYRVMFLEEPIQPENNDALEWLGQHTTQPLATGERLLTKFEFEDLISRQLVSYVQPDVIWSGGISECKKIAAMAESKYIDVVLHNPASFSDVGGMASLHIDACTTNCVITESQPNPKGWEADLYYGATHPIKDGFAELPDKPGLGIEFNEEVWKKHPYEPRERSHNLYDDGAVMDN